MLVKKRLHLARMRADTALGRWVVISLNIWFIMDFAWFVIPSTVERLYPYPSRIRQGSSEYTWRTGYGSAVPVIWPSYRRPLPVRQTVRSPTVKLPVFILNIYIFYSCLTTHCCYFTSKVEVLSRMVQLLLWLPTFVAKKTTYLIMQ